MDMGSGYTQDTLVVSLQHSIRYRINNKHVAGFFPYFEVFFSSFPKNKDQTLSVKNFPTMMWKR